MATEWQAKEFEQAVRNGLSPLKESVELVTTETFALRKCIHDGNLGELQEKINEAHDAVARCEALLHLRMKSFETRLFSGIDRRLREEKWPISGDMHDLRRFLPYSVIVANRADIAPIYNRHRPKWTIVVCDREHNLLFAWWLERKPSARQVAAFADICRDTGFDWGDEGGKVWLYSDGTNPSRSPSSWREYSERLRALSRLRCLHAPTWGSENGADYEKALARWV